MSLQFATDGDTNGVAGKNGVPAADSDRGVCPAMPADPTSSPDVNGPSVSESGKMALNPR